MHKARGSRAPWNKWKGPAQAGRRRICRERPLNSWTHPLRFTGQDGELRGNGAQGGSPRPSITPRGERPLRKAHKRATGAQGEARTPIRQSLVGSSGGGQAKRRQGDGAARRPPGGQAQRAAHNVRGGVRDRHPKGRDRKPGRSGTAAEIERGGQRPDTQASWPQPGKGRYGHSLQEMNVEFAATTRGQVTCATISAMNQKRMYTTCKKEAYREPVGG